ncbi:MAG: Uma2 family endonuclease [Symploca sp. SIO3C6]|nr:Uma2 family endonuclease [Symploca sp. SIO3C6]
MGYEIPDIDRALGNSPNRVTLTTRGLEHIKARQAKVYQVKVPENFLLQGEGFDILIEITLSYVAKPRRTRRNRRKYLSTWLDWTCSKRGEDPDRFLNRVLKDYDAPEETEKDDGLFQWTLGKRKLGKDQTSPNGIDGIVKELSRSTGTVQKDWATEDLLSFEEYLNYDDGTDNRYELVDGRLELVNPPTFRHLLITKYLERSLDQEISRLQLPWLCFREAGIRTGWRKSRLADVYVVTAEQVREFLDQSAVCQTPPLLAVEVVSPESVKRDYRYKRSEYAALEIPEYWIVDPKEHQITLLLLNEGLYEETNFIVNQSLVSETLTELSLTVEQVLAAGSIQ